MESARKQQEGLGRLAEEWYPTPPSTPKPDGSRVAGGWVYGWKLHLATTVASVWIPLTAHLTPADVADNRVAAPLIEGLPPGGALRARGQALRCRGGAGRVCEGGAVSGHSQARSLPAYRRGGRGQARLPYVRRVVSENFNEHFKAIFDVHGAVPTKGETNTARFALGAVLVYQLALLYRHERKLEINRGLKSFSELLDEL